MLKIHEGYYQTRISFLKRAKFFEGGKIVVSQGLSNKTCTLLLDQQLTPLQISRVQEWFAQGPLTEAKIFPLTALKEIVPNEPIKLATIETIAVSPEFKRNQLQTGVLQLRLESVLEKARAFEQQKGKGIFQNQVRTLYLKEGVELPKARGGTLYQTGFQTNLGGELFKKAITKFFPFNPAEIFQRDPSKFYDWLIDNIGRKPEVIGTFSLELSLLKYMLLWQEIFLNDPIFQNMALAFREARGYLMRIELLKKEGPCLIEYDQELQENITKHVQKIFRNLLSRSSVTDLSEIALLSLLVALNAVSLKEAGEVLQGKTMDAQFSETLEQVKNYLMTEESRIFSLRMVLEAIKTLG